MTFILSGVSRFTQLVVGRVVGEQVGIGSVIMFGFSHLLNPCPSKTSGSLISSARIIILKVGKN